MLGEYNLVFFNSIVFYFAHFALKSADILLAGEIGHSLLGILVVRSEFELPLNMDCERSF